MIPSSWTSILLAACAFSTAFASPTSRFQRTKRLTPKYFTEPGGSLALSHYDQRYFKGEISYEEHRDVLRQLIRSYLTTLHEHGVETWLAHGTLLGWWWNGQIMPWDYDLDVQVSNNTMTWLGENMNRTEHTHSFNDVSKTYLLDVNPHHVDLTRGDGMNIIDARWIDTSNGMFIDITAVRERDADMPGTWSCKNKHRYGSQDLWPMRVTEFEGVKARIPYNFEDILRGEYGDKSLVVEEFQGHRWNRDINEWVKMTDDEMKQRREAAEQRKREELEKKGQN
ncbi:hypothetical protein N5P37_010497 [Trichoderma harzianum]|uniref:LicD/FKTN/FKRP nucleotidyltransferase domain-containing protein n=1 Tax=Trichoderma harzianum CBS 226.95 TaxID=983964 RepID=A0A2T4A0G7_TRIHA|nr:hypothetical protein M431DRAFT_95139 [Trichoderma harzianum CBS 226.95]KAK0756972.1 hypothetical protein N5P37_010497 [Trichoderma harzianum]PKK50192.1 hypothetical protein CI102_7184 [Trichoderma harzianum]PTB50550.1 hypothetical protein M431DRAFT_95139 [Trichoderma harzianum CBS 226.95]